MTIDLAPDSLETIFIETNKYYVNVHLTAHILSTSLKIFLFSMHFIGYLRNFFRSNYVCYHWVVGSMPWSVEVQGVTISVNPTRVSVSSTHQTNLENRVP